MITFTYNESTTLAYDDAIDLYVVIGKPRRIWNKARTVYTDKRATVTFLARTFTGPEAERLAELLRQAAEYANKLNTDFDRETLTGTASTFNLTEGCDRNV